MAAKLDLISQIKHLKIELYPTDQLVPYARNARKHDEWQINQLVKAFQQYGFLVPIIVDDTGEIVAGHGRVMAALKMNLPEIPTISSSHLTKAQRRAFTILDNRLAEKSTWDFGLLEMEMSELEDDGYTREDLGFDSVSWDLSNDENSIDSTDENLDGIISTIKVKCPQNIKDEVLIYLKGKLLETSFEGVEVA